MNQNTIIENTKLFVQKTLQDAEGGHDWFHIERVYNNAMHIAKTEKVDLFIIALGSLLHDIADAKFYDGDENIGPKKARLFLESQFVSEAAIQHVENIIRYISFKGEIGLKKSEKKFTSKELDVIQDADRLDAIGAIGIARTFNYGGFKNRVIYDPAIKPNPQQSKEAYKKSTAPTINHFYEKLLLLKDRMNTNTGKRLAQERHQFMELFLKQFYEEWEGLK
jgi:uncharacterized protein